MTASYPPMLSAPVPGAIPCFRLPEFDLEGQNHIPSMDAVIASWPAGTAVMPLEERRPSLPLFDTRPARKPRVKWTPHCTQILVAKATECTNAELVELIAAETGLRFSLDTVNTRRCLLGLDTPGRNEWTAPLRRWRPWQGGRR
ncbi:MAG: hypothetical protein K2X72_19695 [Reyranella sp.]|nr:hypothetical protein [Reyranella sp.]